ncbi:MAG: hypothetical protein ACSHYF_05575 [Verrucomicrobiaceae bacterium]
MMMKHATFLTGLLFCVGGILPGHAQFRELWHLGENDGNAGEFTQEIGGSAPEPGSASKRDDDYYFAGIYPAPIGELTENETITDAVDTSNNSANPTGFERAVTHTNTNGRIHFNMSPSEADPNAVYRLTVRLVDGGFWDGAANGGFGTHDVEVRFNDAVVHTATDIIEDREIVETLDPATVGAVSGPNKIEIIRTGGVNNGTVNGWIQFDDIALEIDESQISCTEALCNFAADSILVRPGEDVTLTWLTGAGANVSIDQGVGSVSAGSGSVVVNPAATTTYTITSELDGDTATGTVKVSADLLYSFTTDVNMVTPTLPNATLQWEVDPAAGVTVEIDNGIGDVTAQTFSGFGSMQVSPKSDTTYTMTVTRPNAPENDVETSSVFIDFEYDDYTTLWVLGFEDDSTAELNQELNGIFDAPGSATSRDDDYYFAGIYPAPIGVVATDETLTDPVDQNNTSANPVGMERAITAGAPNSRIHFNLTASEARGTNEYRFQTTLMGGGWWNGDLGVSGAGFGTHDVDILFNGQPIFSEVDIQTVTDVRKHFTASSVNAVAGENVVEIIRRGGASNPANPEVSNGWIQWDYFSLESRESTASPLGFQITDYSHDSDTQMSTVTFPSSTGETFKIEVSADLSNWIELEDFYLAEVGESSTSYSYSAPDENGFVRVTRN